MSIYLGVVVLYLVVVAVISLSRVGKTDTHAEYMVGGRRAGTFFMIMTLIATWTGAGSLIGGAGLAYRQGFSELWMSAGAWIGIIIIYFFANKIRRIAEYTLPDILEKRYNSAARLFGTLAIIIGCTTIAGYQFKGGAFILEIVTGLPWEKGVLLIAVLAVFLTVLAGMKSVISMDLLNGSLLTVAIVAALFIVISSLGGPAEAIRQLPPEHTTLFGGHNWIWASAVFFPAFFLLMGEPTMYQKFFSCKDESTAKKAVIGWVIGIIIIDIAIASLAAFGRIKFPELAGNGEERVILETARHGLPVWAGCLLLAGAMAIVFSTANSFLLTPATNLTHDIIQRYIVPNAQPKSLVIINSIAVVVLGAVAYLLLTRFRNVLSMALAAYTMIGAGLTPAVLAAFIWKRATPQGGLASVVGGFAGTILTKIVFDMAPVQKFFELNFGIPGAELPEYIIIPAFITAVVMLVVVSLMTPPSPPEKLAPFFYKP